MDYDASPTPPDLLRSWTQPDAAVDSSLQLPGPNVFIPDDFSLVCDRLDSGGGGGVGGNVNDGGGGVGVNGGGGVGGGGVSADAAAVVGAGKIDGFCGDKGDAEEAGGAGHAGVDGVGRSVRSATGALHAAKPRKGMVWHGVVGCGVVWCGMR